MFTRFSRKSGANRGARSRRGGDRKSASMRMETLEARCLLSGVTSYVRADEFPYGSTTDDTGAFWYADYAGTVTKVTLDVNDQPTYLQIALPGAQDIYFNANDHLLYVANQGGSIDQLDLSGNVLQSFTFDTGANTQRTPVQMTVGGDGALWFSTLGEYSLGGENYYAEVGRLDISSGDTIFYSTGTTDSQTTGITTDASGNVWFALNGVGLLDANTNELWGSSRIGRITVDAGGFVDMDLYNVPSPGGLIYNLVKAPDGSIWYGSQDDPNDPSVRAEAPDALGRITVGSGGAVTIDEFAIPKTSGQGVIGPGDLAFDDAGNIWFTNQYAGQIGRFSTTTGDFDLISAPVSGTLSVSIAGADVWFTAPFDSQLLRVKADEAVGEIVSTRPDIDASTGVQFSGPVAIFASTLAGDFEYTIDYGDGHTQSGTLANDSSGIYTISGTNTYAVAGSYATRITIRAATGDATSVTGEAVVTEPVSSITVQGVNVSAQEDTALAANVVGIDNVVVATFTASAGTFSASISWGDSTTSVGQIVSLGGNQYAVKVATGQQKVYANQGSYAISVTVSDGTQSVVANAVATITDTPLVASQNLTVNTLIGRIVVDIVATFTDDVDLGANAFRATINWGDNSTSSGIIVRNPFNAGSFIVLGLHSYKRRGTFNISTLITNTVEGTSATATARVTV